MRRRAATILTISGAALVGASGSAVAAPAPPDTVRFQLHANECVDIASGRSCVVANIFALRDGNFGTVDFSVTRYETDTSGIIVSQESEFGSAVRPDIVVTVDKNGSVSLAATPVTVLACDLEACTGTRTVVVSAAASPYTPVMVTRTKTSQKNGDCTTFVTSETKEAGLTGDIAFDGDSYQGQGDLFVQDARTTLRCK